MDSNKQKINPKELNTPYWRTKTPTPEDEEKVQAEFEPWREKLKDNTLLEKVSRLWCLFRNGKLSGFDKAIVVGALLYCISPLDLTPDFIPILGYLDDLLVVLGVLAYLDGKTD